MNILPLTLFWLLLGSLMLDIAPLTAVTKACTDSVGLGAQDRHAKSMRMRRVKLDKVSFPDQLFGVAWEQGLSFGLTHMHIQGDLVSGKLLFWKFRGLIMSW